MSLTVNSKGIAEARIQGLTLRPIVGAYELVFGLDIMVHPHAKEESPRQASVIGAQVTLKTDRGGSQRLGFARPESVVYIEQGPYPNNRVTPSLVMTLQPGQLAAIEQLRDRGDLSFTLAPTGIGADRNIRHELREEWHFPMPHSEWLKHLRTAGARNILLLEVPLPLVVDPSPWREIGKSLQEAEISFRNGDYRGSIASCRTALDELAHQRFGQKDWTGPLLERLAKDRTSMTADERESALWAAVRHYTNLAHHGTSDGGHRHFSRADALLALRMTLSLVARGQTPS